jgi:hypothetical protein
MEPLLNHINFRWTVPSRAGILLQQSVMYVFAKFFSFFEKGWNILLEPDRIHRV